MNALSSQIDKRFKLFLVLTMKLVVYRISPNRVRSFYFFHTSLSCGFYSRAASINASKLLVAIIINTGNLFHTTSLTCRHMDLLILCSYVCHYDSVTGIVSKSGFRSLRESPFITASYYTLTKLLSTNTRFIDSYCCRCKLVKFFTRIL